MKHEYQFYLDVKILIKKETKFKPKPVFIVINLDNI